MLITREQLMKIASINLN
nr:alpha-toxin=200 kda proline-rich protein {N-terminal} [Clostridium novyi, type A, VPI 5771, ATCC 19402, Peptide Partial, 17 aa] [Clostridium novyi]